MDEIKIVNQNMGQSQMQPQVDDSQAPKGKPFWIAISAVILMLVVAVIFIILKPGANNIADRTPLEELDALEASSSPVVATPVERGADLKKLSAQSKEVVLTREDRLKEMQALNQ